jgi:hypothetical protein
MLIEVGITSARAGGARSMVDDDRLEKDVADIGFYRLDQRSTKTIATRNTIAASPSSSKVSQKRSQN